MHQHLWKVPFGPEGMEYRHPYHPSCSPSTYFDLKCNQYVYIYLQRFVCDVCQCMYVYKVYSICDICIICTIFSSLNWNDNSPLPLGCRHCRVPSVAFAHRKRWNARNTFNSIQLFLRTQKVLKALFVIFNMKLLDLQDTHHFDA